jgi:hypothetical protein
MPIQPDCLVDDVLIAPVHANSSLTANFTGIFAILGLLEPIFEARNRCAAAIYHEIPFAH